VRDQLVAAYDLLRTRCLSCMTGETIDASRLRHRLIIQRPEGLPGSPHAAGVHCRPTRPRRPNI
jgi:hypothetical protein